MFHLLILILSHLSVFISLREISEPVFILQTLYVTLCVPPADAWPSPAKTSASKDHWFTCICLICTKKGKTPKRRPVAAGGWILLLLDRSSCFQSLCYILLCSCSVEQTACWSQLCLFVKINSKRIYSLRAMVNYCTCEWVRYTFSSSCLRLCTLPFSEKHIGVHLEWNALHNKIGIAVTVTLSADRL